VVDGGTSKLLGVRPTSNKDMKQKHLWELWRSEV
jgi:hypothetical protein